MAYSYIDFDCVQQDLKRVDSRVVAADAANTVCARFDFCPKWDGLTIYARFGHMGEVYDVQLTDGAAVVPVEVLKPTGFYVSVFGEASDGSRLTSARLFVDVARTIDLDGMPPIPPTPSLLQRFENMVQYCIDIADSVREDADNGAFNGSPFQIVKEYTSIAQMEADETGYVKDGQFVIINTGNVNDEDNAKLYLRMSTGWSFIVDMSGMMGLQGAAATVVVDSTTTLAAGSAATVQNVGTQNAARLRFGIPKGDKGDKGDTGEKGDAGEGVTDSGTGEIVSLENGLAGSPLLAATVYGNSVQDGTPTPEAPVPIQSVTSAALGVAGKNLWRNCASVTTNGITLTNNGNGSVTVNGTASNYAPFRFTLESEIGINTFTMSANASKPIAENMIRMRVRNKEGSYAENGLSELDIARASRTFTGTLYVFEITILEGATIDNVTIYPQLELGTTATAYEPYVGTTTPIDLQGNELRSLPDGTRDTLEVDADGNVKLVKRVGEAVLDGTTNAFIYRGTYPFVHYICIITPYTKVFQVEGSAMCTSLAIGTNGSNHIYSPNGSGFYLREPSFAEDLSTVNAWFAANNTTVLYPLATPQEISLGTIEMPALPSNVANVWAATDVPTDIRAEWFTVAGEQVDRAQDMARDAKAAADGKADAEHSHAWGEITEKPTSFAPSDHEHDASDITSGAVPIANGGTGAASANMARLNLDVYSRAQTEYAVQEVFLGLVAISEEEAPPTGTPGTLHVQML